MPITPFQEVWEYIKDITGSFTRTNAEKLYEVALQADGVMVEVGVDQGRSASVLLFAARQTGASLLLVDSWPSVLIHNMGRVSDRLADDFLDISCQIAHGLSVEVAPIVKSELSLVHIDANHYGEGPEEDCVAWLPKLRSGGFACFHDYGTGNEAFKAVDVAVDKHCAGWEDLGAWEGLGIRRKP